MVPTYPDRFKAAHSNFVDHSIKVRLPGILRSVLEKSDGNSMCEDVRSKILSAAISLEQGTFVIETLKFDDNGPCWAPYESFYSGKNATEIDWWFLENYMYRLLLHWTGYFETGVDPFSEHKALAIEAGIEHLRSIELQPVSVNANEFECFQKFLSLSLWGNRADLSLSAGVVGAHTLEVGENSLLVDDSKEAFHKLGDAKSVIIILDNCGTELLNDLLFAEYLLSNFPQISVTLHCKSHPVFVSDAMKSDVSGHIEALEKISRGQKLGTFMKEERLSLFCHPFYTTPLSFWDVPNDLKTILFDADMVISKGDANYRRLVGDGLWPHSTDFNYVLSYWKSSASVLALRTCKSPVAIGLDSFIQEKAKAADPNWLFNGKFGMIQLKR